MLNPEDIIEGNIYYSFRGLPGEIPKQVRIIEIDKRGIVVRYESVFEFDSPTASSISTLCVQLDTDYYKAWTRAFSVPMNTKVYIEEYPNIFEDIYARYPESFS